MAEALQGRDVRNPTVIHVGRGALNRLPETLQDLGIHRAVLVTDRVMGASVWMDRLTTMADAADVKLTITGDLDNEPTTRDVDTVVTVLRSTHAEAVIGFGGGSALDTAKSAAVLAGNSGELRDYEGYERIPHAGLPLVAIPTTSGTGSEVTRGVAVTDSDRNVKMLLMSSRLVPTAAIVDPSPTLTMPKSITASTGLDALTHAIEAYVSRRRQPLTDALALDAIVRIAASLARAYKTPGDIEAREQMSIASLHAGMAFHNSSVALVHGMSRPIGAYFHVPHGLSNAMLLPTVMAFSITGDVTRYGAVARAMGVASTDRSDTSAAEAGVAFVCKLCSDLDVPTPTAWGIDREKFRQLAPQMALDAISSGSPGNNPRTANEQEIIGLYEEVIAA